MEGNLTNKYSAWINKSYFDAASKEESEVWFLNNELLHGVLDKNSLGNNSFGLFHAFYELFGPFKTRMLTTAITRLCISFLKLRGFSLLMEDLYLH